MANPYAVFEEEVDAGLANTNTAVLAYLGDNSSTYVVENVGRSNGRRFRNLTLASTCGALVFGSEIANQYFQNNHKISSSWGNALTVVNYSFIGVILERGLSTTLSDENRNRVHSFLARWTYEWLLQVPTQVQLNFAREGLPKYAFDAFFYSVMTNNLSRDGEAIIDLKHRDRAPCATFKGERAPMWGWPVSHTRRLALIEGLFLTATVATFILQKVFPEMNVDQLNLPNELAAFVMGSSLGRLGMHGLIRLSDRLEERLDPLFPYQEKPPALAHLSRFFTLFELIEPLLFSVSFSIPHPAGMAVAGAFLGANSLYGQARAESRVFHRWRTEYEQDITEAQGTAIKVEWVVTGIFTAWMLGWYIGFPLHDTLVGDEPTSTGSWINLACFLASYIFSFAGGKLLSKRQERDRENGFFNMLEHLFFDTSLPALPFLYGFKKLNMDDDGIDGYYQNSKGLYIFAVAAWISLGMTYGLNRAAGFRPRNYTRRAMTPPVAARILGGKTLDPIIALIKKKGQ
jgi:hypothetical protein